MKTFALTMAYEPCRGGRTSPFETTALGLVAAEAGAVGNAHDVTARGATSRDVEAAATRTRGSAFGSRSCA